MANHFMSINRGVSGTKISDITFGTSTNAGADFELRIANVDAQGKVPTDLDVRMALEAFKLAIGTILYTTFPPL
jgi:hypothetical protein